MKIDKIGKLKQGDKLISVIFVCHGNICRSPMAEFVFRDLVKRRGMSELFQVSSAATSTEEIGNPVHRGTREKLRQYGISTEGKCAVQLKAGDYVKYDYLIGMDERNIINMRRIAGGDPVGKIKRLLDFSHSPRDIADPWYTGNFDKTYEDVLEGCEALLNKIVENR